MPDPLLNHLQLHQEQSSLASQSVTTNSSDQQQDPSMSSSTDQQPKPGLFRRPRLLSSGTNGSTITQDSTTIPLSPRQVNSSNQEQNLSSEEVNRKRPRVSKACTYCRLKKVKCDGNLPCFHCQESNDGDCVYVGDPRKKPKARALNPSSKNPPKTAPIKSPKVNKAQTIKQLSLKLDKIENLLGVLTDEIRGTKQSKGNRPLSPPIKIDEDDTGVKTEDVARSTDQGNHKPNVPHITSNKFASHSILDIFSKSSLESMFQGLGPCNRVEVRDILHIGSIYNFFSHAFMDSICQPIKTTIRSRTDLIDNTFNNASIPLEILTYFDDIYIASYICDSSYVKSLFESYFNNNKKVYTKGPNSKLRSFTWSELMIMTILIGLCISILVDERNVNKMKKKTDAAYITIT